MFMTVACKRVFVLVCCVAIFIGNALSQTLSVPSVVWEGEKRVHDSVGKEILTLGVKLGQYDKTGLPWIGGKGQKLAGYPSNLVVESTSFVFESCSNQEAKVLKDLGFENGEFQLRLRTGVERNQTFLIWSVCPLRKRAGIYEKLISADIDFKTQHPITSRGISNGFVGNSVLSSGSGKWFKIGVVDDGIHVLTYDFIESIGVEVETLASSSIHVFGNGQGMLSIKNSVVPIDDLAQNSIFVQDGNDGVFGPGDYVIFYAKGPHSWRQSGNQFRHLTNVYSDTSFYFVNIDGSRKQKKVEEGITSNKQPTQTIATYNDWVLHEKEIYNFLRSGSQWFGERYDVQTQMDYEFSIANISKDSTSTARVRFIGQSKVGSTYFNVRELQSNAKKKTALPKIISSVQHPLYATVGNLDLPFVPKTDQVKISVEYDKNGVESNVGWLDYIELNVYRDLVFAGKQLDFRHTRSVGLGNVNQYQITSPTGIEQIWEVTEHTSPQKVNYNISGNKALFRMDADSLRTFVVWNRSSAKVPSFFGEVKSQNLHGLGNAQMLIVTHSKFRPAAEELKKVHESEGLSVHLVTDQQVYNEFSSGMRDPMAIRRLCKMFYDRANSSGVDPPKYLLLFGDASYDQRNYLSPNTNYIPVFQSSESLSPLYSFMTDDYFGLLDDSESNKNEELLDIAVGRIPCKTLEEAFGVVNKIKIYSNYEKAPTSQAHCEENAESIYGGWRNVMTIVGDDEDGNVFFRQSEGIYDLVKSKNPSVNIHKLYLDSYKQVSSSGGQRYPEVAETLKQRVQSGALVVNYLGHGGETGWAHEKVLDLKTITGWTNLRKLPLFMTATCEFTRFDDPNRTSAGELVLLNPKGGGIALFTTTRVVYAYVNAAISVEFYDVIFNRSEDGTPLTLGEILLETKNRFASLGPEGADNFRRFTLIGDPAVRLALPRYNVVSTSINNIAIDSITDTVGALSLVTVQGAVLDDDSIVMKGFNGFVYPMVYDKEQKMKTLGNDKGSTAGLEFMARTGLIYRGKATIVNGKFKFSFVVPKDIGYNFGSGRISYYAHNNSIDAGGYDQSLIIGGKDTSSPSDNMGPDIRLFMNDEKFVSGGITDQNPSIFAKISDENGINTVGNGIGHDIVAVLDEDTKRSLVLNDYYQADLDTYKSGIVEYPFSELAEGRHSLSLKVWDVHNNSSKEVTEFVVAKSSKMALEHVLNYPNPFSDRTQFMFEHNQACSYLNVHVQIFTISGKVVKTIDQTVHTKGYRVDPIYWDGKDDFGDKLGRGTYIYKIKVLNQNGDLAEQLEKLVIIN